MTDDWMLMEEVMMVMVWSMITISNTHTNATHTLAIAATKLQQCFQPCTWMSTQFLTLCASVSAFSLFWAHFNLILMEDISSFSFLISLECSDSPVSCICSHHNVHSTATLTCFSTIDDSLDISDFCPLVSDCSFSVSYTPNTRWCIALEYFTLLLSLLWFFPVWLVRPTVSPFHSPV